MRGRARAGKLQWPVRRAGTGEEAFAPPGLVCLLILHAVIYTAVNKKSFLKTIVTSKW